MSWTVNLVVATALLGAATASALGPHVEPVPVEDWPDSLRTVAIPTPLAWLVEPQGCSAYRLTFLRVAEYVADEIVDASDRLPTFLRRELAYCGFLGRRN